VNRLKSNANKSRPVRPDHQHASMQPSKIRKKKWPLFLVIFIDVSLVGVGLIVFALFHHVIPREIKTSVVSLPRPTSATTKNPSSETTFLPETTPTDVKSKQSATSKLDDVILETTTEATVDPDDWHVKFADQFSKDGVIITEDSYRSLNLALTIEKVQRDDAVCMVADIYLSDIDQLRTAFASQTYGRGLTDEVLNMSLENNALLAISGDYYGIRDQGIVIRNGQLYRDVLFQDVLTLFYDGRMETQTAEAFDMDRILTEGAWQAWSFGPMLLDDGQPMTKFNSRVNPDNPRTAIGYYEPGHYCFVLVDGRRPDYSNGMTLQELSQFFYDLGCRVAYNLDGGQSAIMTFMDRIVNQPYKGGRPISDIVFVIDDTDGQ
jgi:exopolysaccharide biosynthesis protein